MPIKTVYSKIRNIKVNKWIINSVKLLFSFIILISSVYLITYLSKPQTNVYAASRTWDGGGGANTNWSTCTNWSLDTCPIAGDTVVFDNTSANNSVWDASGPASIGTLTVNANYAGTLTLGRDVTISGNLTYSGANFAHGNHKISFTGNGATWTFGTVTYYDIEINTTGSNILNGPNSGAATVAHTLTLTTGKMASSLSINLAGDLTTTNFTGGAGTITLNGSGNQTITGSGVEGQGTLPNIVINKTNGIMTIASIISLGGNWTYTSIGSGSFVNTSSTLVCYDNACTISGSHTLNNLTFYANSAERIITIPNATTLTVNATLSLKGTFPLGFLATGGIIAAKADITVTNTGGFPSSGNTCVVQISGTGTQTLTGSGVEGQGVLPAVSINKASGNLTLSGIITVDGVWTFTSMGTGSLIVTSSTLVVGTYGNVAGGIVGSHTLNNLTFTNTTTDMSTASIVVSNTITVNGTLAIKGNKNLRWTAGTAPATIDAKADITITNTGTIPTGTSGAGNAIFQLSGTVNQTLTGSGTEGQGVLPKITINKASGILTLASVISVASTWTFTSVGTGSLAVTGSTVAFYDSNGNGYTILGTQTLNNVTFVNNNTFAAAFYLDTGIILTVNGTLAIKGSQFVKISTISGSPTIDVKGDITVTNTSVIPAGQANSASVIRINGTANQTLTGSGVECGGVLSGVTINKPTSGNLTLSGVISVSGAWTYTAVVGSFITTSSTVVFCDSNGSGFTIAGTHTLNNVTFINNNAFVAGFSLNTGVTLTVSGTLAIKGSQFVRIGGVSGSPFIDVQGNVTVTNTSTIPVGQNQGTSTVIRINGTANQILTGSGVECGGPLPPVTINKATSGNLTLSGMISTAGAWTYTTVVGSFITTSSTLVFCDNNGSGINVSGTQSYNNVIFNNSKTYAGDYQITNNSTITVNGTFSIKGSTYIRIGNSAGTGNFVLNGDITVTNTATIPATITASSAILNINGTGPQVFTGSGVDCGGVLGPVTINKASGNLTLSSTISVGAVWTYTSMGTGSLITTSSTVAFCDSNGAGYSITGSHTLNNVTFSNNNTYVASGFTITVGTALTVTGTLAFKGTTFERLGGSGTISAQGNITITNTATIPSGQTSSGVVITINGTGDQVFTGSGVEGQGVMGPITINKASGNLTLASIISVSYSWVYTSMGTGTLITTGSTLVLYDNNGGTYTSSGTFSLNNLTFYNTSVTSIAFTISNTITVTGTLAFKGTARAGITTGTINAQGDITITSTGSDTTNGGGTGTININGTGTQTLTGSGTVDQGPIPNVTINKSSGTLNLVSTITVTGRWLWSAGTVNAGTSIIYWDYAQGAALTFTPGTVTYNNVNVSPATLQTLSLGGNLTLTGTLTKGGHASSSLSTTASNYSITTGNFTISAGTFTANNSNITISGNYTNSATMTKGGSTFIFNGAGSSTIEPGASPFNNFTVNTASKALLFSIVNSTVINGTITLNGSACLTTVTLNSTNGSSQFTINATGTQSMSYIQVTNSIATTAATANNSKTGGNNTNWTINLGTCANTAPNAPTSLAEKYTNDTVVATGGWLNQTSVKFTATASDPDNPDTIYLCVEKDILGTAFSNTEDLCGTGVAYSGSGVAVSVTITGITDQNEYHWQARVKDAGGLYSSWVSYDVNAESARDFGIDTTAPTGGTVYDGTSVGVDVSFNDGSLSSLSANWSGVTYTVSGLNKYEYSVGTTQGGTDIVSWTSNGTATSVTLNALSLKTSLMYFFNIRTTDNATNTSIISSNGQVVAPSLAFSLDSSTVTFNNLNSGNSYTDTKTSVLTTTTNAYNGYVIRAFETDVLRSTTPAATIANFSAGSYASPSAWGGTDYGYGYTSSDTSIQGAGKFPASGACPGTGTAPCYAPFASTGPGDIVADHTAVVQGSPITNEQFTITYKVQTAAIQTAAKYTTAIVYTIMPQY